jgi:hypothetical protein
MNNFNIVDDCIARFKILKSNIIIVGGKTKSDPEYVSIVLNNLSPTFKTFSIISYNIPFFVKGATSLKKIFSNPIQHQIILRNINELSPRDQTHLKAISIPSKYKFDRGKGEHSNPLQEKTTMQLLS